MKQIILVILISIISTNVFCQTQEQKIEIFQNSLFTRCFDLKANDNIIAIQKLTKKKMCYLHFCLDAFDKTIDSKTITDLNNRIVEIADILFKEKTPVFFISDSQSKIEKRFINDEEYTIYYLSQNSTCLNSDRYINAQKRFNTRSGELLGIQ